MCQVVKATNTRLIALDKAIASGNIQEVVDICAELNVAYKSLDKALENAKGILREYAKQNNKSVIDGVLFAAKLTAKNETVIDPQELQALMKREGLYGRFWDFVKVKVGDVTKFMGEASIGSIAGKMPGTPSVSFKKIDG